MKNKINFVILTKKRTFVSVDCYKTIAQYAAAEIKVKGSRFLALAYPVISADEVRAIVAAVRSEHYSARHHCYAYRLGARGAEFRASDDGEPSGTAGRPILGQLLSCDLSDVLVVVVRYFGGTLLGVPGLIAAYKEAAGTVLDEAGQVEKIIKVSLEVNFDYALMDRVLRAVRTAEAEVLSMDCDERGQAVVEFSVRKSKAEQLGAAVEQIIKY